MGPNAAEALILPSEPSIEAPVGKLEVIEKVADVQEKVDHNAVCNTKNAKLCRKEVPSYPMALFDTAPVGPHSPKANISDL